MRTCGQSQLGELAVHATLKLVLLDSLKVMLKHASDLRRGVFPLLAGFVTGADRCFVFAFCTVVTAVMTDGRHSRS